MSVNDWLILARKKLEKASISTARLDALVLLEDASDKDRSWLLAHPEFELTGTLVEKLDSQIVRRAGHEPLAYIRGKTEFYGREFIINQHVLEPRPESETMIDLLKQLKASNSTIVDVGTGSGALAITAQLELPNAEVIGIDIDENCLNVAQKNAKELNADVSFFSSDLLSFLPGPTNPVKDRILLCNLPYVPDSFTINLAALNEPRLAIFGGTDGLDLYRKLFRQIDGLEVEPNFILTESMPPQHEELAEIAGSSGYELIKTDDFIQQFELR